jgi:hypothetical protein
MIVQRIKRVVDNVEHLTPFFSTFENKKET